jgi:hypothetical protein
MKKLMCLSLVLTISSVLLAQTTPFDVKGISNQIVTKLSQSLSLTADQIPAASEAITEFLTQKGEIIPLQTSDPATYASKFNVLNGALVGKLKNILQAKQMTSFWSLKPRSNDPSNVLSHLFY